SPLPAPLQNARSHNSSPRDFFEEVTNGAASGPVRRSDNRWLHRHHPARTLQICPLCYLTTYAASCPTSPPPCVHRPRTSATTNTSRTCRDTTRTTTPCTSDSNSPTSTRRCSTPWKT